MHTHTHGHLVYLFEGLQNLLPLTEVPKEELQSARHQGRVVMHRQMEQDSEEGPAAVVVQVQRGVLLTEEACERGRPGEPQTPCPHAPWLKPNSTASFPTLEAPSRDLVLSSTLL